jgi:regulator of sigma E protease
VGLNGSPVFSFEHLRASLQETTTEEVELTLWREGEESQLTMAPQVTEYEGEQLRLIGVYSNAEFIPLKFIQTESKGLLGSLGLAVSRTWDVTVKTIEGFKKLFMGQATVK